MGRTKKKQNTNTNDEDGNNNRSWPKGKKRVMLEKYEEMFNTNRSAMYNQATDEFIRTWGYKLPPEVAPEPDVDYTPPDINTFPEGAERGKEVKSRSTHRRKVKKKIINWANYHFRHKLAKSDQKLVSMITETVRELREEVPRKKTDVQRYQELHYADRVKDDFDNYWEGGANKLISGNYRLSEMNKFSKEKWEMEDEEFMKLLREENARIYAEDLMKYSQRGNWTGSAEDYSDAWLRSKTVIAATVDAIAKHFGVAVILLAAGPRDDGVIRTESITSIVPTSQTNDSFQTFNPEKCQEIHEHCTAFAKHVFLKSECESRIFKRGGSSNEVVDVDVDQQPGWERFSSSDSTGFTPAAAPVIRPIPADHSPTENVAVQGNAALSPALTPSSEESSESAGRAPAQASAQPAASSSSPSLAQPATRSPSPPLAQPATRPVQPTQPTASSTPSSLSQPTTCPVTTQTPQPQGGSTNPAFIQSPAHPYLNQSNANETFTPAPQKQTNNGYVDGWNFSSGNLGVDTQQQAPLRLPTPQPMPGFGFMSQGDAGYYNNSGMGMQQDLLPFNFNDPALWDMNVHIPVPMSASGSYNLAQYDTPVNTTTPMSGSGSYNTSHGDTVPKKRKRQTEEDALMQYAEDILGQGENGVKRARRSAKPT
ncbi:hypothetical protein VNI00_007344 [Paramarasmius palmivorus]|uniref:Uncharacterized protein n=1 Tax=Paramarasmius palmivorus TaxID=297713 RepID=A0AAW0D2I6_9AGAR